MAYFNSAKNRAIWEKELNMLRAEREVRRKNGFKPVENKNDARKFTQSNPFRRRITLEELERIEMIASGVRKVVRPKRKVHEATAGASQEREKQNTPKLGMNA